MCSGCADVKALAVKLNDARQRLYYRLKSMFDIMLYALIIALVSDIAVSPSEVCESVTEVTALFGMECMTI